MQEQNEEKLFQLLKEFQIGTDIDPEERIKTLHQLEEFPHDEAVNTLNFFLTHETNPQVLIHITKTLGKYNNKSSVNNLVELLLWREKFKENLQKDDYLKVRCMIATILGNIKDTSAVLPLMYILNNKDENYKLRLAAAEALGRIGDKYAVAPLIEVVSDENEKSIYLRESAAKALGMLGDTSAVDALVSILEAKKGIIDKFTFLKERIIESIGRLGFRDDRTIRVLSDTLLDASPYIRIESIEALSEIDDQRVIPLIEKMLDDESEEVARAAIDALYNINGKEYISNLLNKANLPGWCKDEIDMIISEYEEDNEYEQ